MAIKKTKTMGRKAKKVWYPLVAPKLFANQVLGKSLVYTAEQLIDKPITVNLMNLTGDIKSQNINIGFRVQAIRNGQGIADIWSYKIIPAHIKRIVRRKRDKVEDSFILKSKDNIKLRIKPLVLTLNKTSASVRRQLRKKIKTSLVKTFSNLTLEDAIRQILMRKLQSILRKELNKITPIKSCEIRMLGRLSKKSEEKAKVVSVPKEIKLKIPKKEAVKEQKK